MSILKVPVDYLSKDAFAPFGDVLAKPGRPADIAHATYSWWDTVAKVDAGGETVELGWLTVYRRPFSFDRMERHQRATQTFIPLDGKPLIFCVAPPSDPAIGALPEPQAIRAFFFDGSKGVQIRPGIWHLTLFPLAEQAEVLLVLRTNTPYDDSEWCDLRTLYTQCALDFSQLSGIKAEEQAR